MGPVQVLVVGFDQPNFSGEVLAELARLGEAGIVRLVDLLLISRAEDGTLETLSAPAGTASDLSGELAAELLGRSEGDVDNADSTEDPDTEDADAWSLANAIPIGSVAAVALIEHVWAAPLTAAIRRAGGSPLEETWLAPGDLDRLEVLVARRQG